MKYLFWATIRSNAITLVCVFVEPSVVCKTHQFISQGTMCKVISGRVNIKLDKLGCCNFSPLGQMEVTTNFYSKILTHDPELMFFNSSSFCTCKFLEITPLST